MMSGSKNKKKPAGQKNKQQKNTVAVKRSAIDGFFDRYPHAWLWLSGLLPVTGLVIMYACMGIYPFGDKSVAAIDMMQQYAAFYASLKHAVFGGNGLAYARSLGMGGSYWGLIGYYLTSPFAVLSLLVPNEHMMDYMQLQELIKVGLGGVSFACFYSRKFGRKDATAPLLALCYALSGFMTVHLCTIIWTDSLVLLPLIIWGLEELLRGRRPWRYVLCLSLAGICNYYIALMIGIYLVLYAAAFLWVEYGGLDVKKLMKKILMFSACSLLSAGIGAVILLPSALLLSENGAGRENIPLKWLTMNPLRLAAQMIYDPDCHIIAADSFPLLYCSVFAVMLLPLFFLCRGISGRVKAAFGGLAGFMLLSFVIGPLNDCWHGGHATNSLPYRYAFLLVFTFLMMGGYVLRSFQTLSQNAFNAVLMTVMAAAAVSYFSGVRESVVMFAGTFALAVIYTVVFYLRSGEKLTSPAAAALAMAVVFGELVSGGVLAWRGIDSESSYTPRADYIQHDRDIEAAADRIAVSDSDVYRVETLTGAMLNDNALIGQSGMSCFSSTNSYGLMKLLSSMGYNSDRKVAYYQKSFTPLADSMMNVKYVIYHEDAGEPPYLERVGSAGGYYIYRNTLALPGAFAVSDSLLHWDTAQPNPFDVQNDLIRRAVSDGDLTVYEPLALSAAEEESFNASFTEGSMTVRAAGRLVLRATSPGRRHLYVYVRGRYASDIRLSVGDKQFSLMENDAYIADCGWCEAGETVTVEIRTGGDEVEGFVSAAFLNEPSLLRGLDGLRARAAKVSWTGENCLRCEVQAQAGEMLFTSVPYEKGWRAEVNGQPVETVAVGGGLIGLPLDEGSNTVVLRYRMRGFGAGAAISLISLGAALWLLFGREVRNRLRQRTDRHLAQ